MAKVTPRIQAGFMELLPAEQILFNKYVQRNSIEYWDAHYFLKYETLNYKMK